MSKDDEFCDEEGLGAWSHCRMTASREVLEKYLHGDLPEVDSDELDV